MIYGSTNLRPGKFEAPDLIISDPAVVLEVGLFKPTRFYFSDLREVPLNWDDTGFECWDGYSSPILGRLSSRLINDAKYCLAIREVASGVSSLLSPP